MTIMGPGVYGIFRRFFYWVNRNRPIPLFGSGKNRMQMVSTSDMVDACLLAEKSRVRGEIVNIGSENVPSLKELFQAVIEHTDSKSKLLPMNATLLRTFFRTLRVFHLSPLVPEHYFLLDKEFILDISKAKRLLKWKPKKNNIQMIIEAYDSFNTSAA